MSPIAPRISRMPVTVTRIYGGAAHGGKKIRRDPHAHGRAARSDRVHRRLRSGVRRDRRTLAGICGGTRAEWCSRDLSTVRRIARYAGRSVHLFKVHARALGIPLEDFLAQASSGTLLKRLPTSADVANVATIMASDRAGAMTGAFVSVTCGPRTD